MKKKIKVVATFTALAMLFLGVAALSSPEGNHKLALFLIIFSGIYLYKRGDSDIISRDI